MIKKFFIIVIFSFFLNQVNAEENIMILKLKDGDVVIELFPQVAPNHVKRFKQLAEEIKTKLSVGGSFKNDSIIIQGDYRDEIMTILKEKGFLVKRVGG